VLRALQSCTTVLLRVMGGPAAQGGVPTPPLSRSPCCLSASITSSTSSLPLLLLARQTSKLQQPQGTVVQITLHLCVLLLLLHRAGYTGSS
jgi:hypothetical protein